METNDHAPGHRIYVRRWIAVVALAGLPLAAASQSVTGDLYKSDFETFRANVIGTGSQSPAVGGTSAAITTTPTATAARVGGMNFYSSGSGSTVGGAADFKFGNFKVPANVRIPVQRQSMGRAIARFGLGFLGPIGAGASILLTLYDIGAYAEYDPATGKNKIKKNVPGDASGQFTSDQYAACQAWGSGGAGVACVISYEAVPPYPCLTKPSNLTSAWTCSYAEPTMTVKTLTEQELADLIAAQSGWPSGALPQTIADAVNAGQPIKLYTDQPAAPVPQGTLTGPPTVALPKVETKLTVAGPAAGETTTTWQENYPQISCDYVFPKVNCRDTSKTTTTTTTTKPDGTTSTAVVTTDAEKPVEVTGEKPESDPCKANPNRIGCAEFGQDDTKIPKRTETLTYTPETVLGGGSCPANQTITVGGQAIVPFDWPQACDKIVAYVRPLFLAMGAFIALVILVPGGLGRQS